MVDFGHIEVFPMPANFSSLIVRFGTFEVNFQTGELRQRGQKVKLQEQPLQVLAALLERPGEWLPWEELRKKLWPEDTFVDFDHSLNAAIKRLRDALGASADAPVFIETLARRGYRFIAPGQRILRFRRSRSRPSGGTTAIIFLDSRDGHRQSLIDGDRGPGLGDVAVPVATAGGH
jgi:DNA-binding winged helix-turn-helix (wHTH) protein